MARPALPTPPTIKRTDGRGFELAFGEWQKALNTTIPDLTRRLVASVRNYRAG